MDVIIATRNLYFNQHISYADMDIVAGRITFIQGPSGAGKSSLLKLFNGVLSPLKGAVYYQNQDISTLDSIKLRREVLLAGQDVFLFDGSLRNNFHQFYEYRDQQPPTDKNIRHYLKLCLADFPLNIDCGHLSGGEKQRVFLAVNLSFNAKVLLLDEPTSALDRDRAEQVLKNIIQEVKAINGTLIVVTHDSSLLPLADDIININGE